MPVSFLPAPIHSGDYPCVFDGICLREKNPQFLGTRGLLLAIKHLLTGKLHPERLLGFGKPKMKYQLLFKSAPLPTMNAKLRVTKPSSKAIRLARLGASPYCRHEEQDFPEFVEHLLLWVDGTRYAYKTVDPYAR